MLRNIRISKKVPILIVLCSLVSAFIVGMSSYNSAHYAISDVLKNKLISIEKNRVKQLSDYLKSIEEELIIVASSPYTLQAVEDFKKGWDEIGIQGNQTKILQDLYIHNNPHKLGEKEKLDFAKDGSFYSKSHAKHHVWFRSLLNQRGYYDIFLFDADGNLVYSVFKEADYATNLNIGKWKDTDLGKAYRAARKQNRDEVSYFDFKPYEPSNGAPASFISTPIMNEAGRVSGVLVFQMPIGRINSIMQDSYGMGRTGETYIVGSDYFMRSDSRFSEESTILKTKVDSISVKKALKGEDGVEIVRDYRGILVGSAYSSLDFLGTRWAIVAEIDKSEMEEKAIDLRNQAFLIMASLALIISVIGLYFAKQITKPISLITIAMSKLAVGDTSVTVPESNREDEIGEMGKALLVFKENKIEADRLAEEQKIIQQKQLDRAKNLEVLTSNFESNISALLNGLAAASTELDSTAQSMSNIANRTTEQSTAMSNISGSTAQNIQTVASAAEQLSASIRELSQQVNNTSQAANAANADVDVASKQIGELLEAGEKIGNIVGLIQDIAEQTNLLALNATIESARAGEAGKGFAVVANEVKALATETYRATEQIGAEVQTVQGQVRNAVEAVRNIEEKISGVSDAANAIAAAIEEQNAVTEEISRNTQTSAQNVQGLNETVAVVHDASQETGDAASNVLIAAQELSEQSNSLKMQIATFIKNVKEA